MPGSVSRGLFLPLFLDCPKQGGSLDCVFESGRAADREDVTGRFRPVGGKALT